MKALPRRQFLQTAASAAVGVTLASAVRGEETPPPAQETSSSFSFPLLGDLHFDKLEHHDMEWLDRNKKGDLGQIKNYSRITAEIMPKLFGAVRETVADLNRDAATRVPFVLQVGDLVEGLCGSEERAVRQNQEALDFVRGAQLGVPFVFAKGNHDVTGDGAPEAFAEVCHRFLGEQAVNFTGDGKPKTAANYTIEHGSALFCFFDAYDTQSLASLEAALAKRTARHCFVIIHPPVVPYGARATWNIYGAARDKAKREKLLEMLGRQNAFVLGGHIHRFNTLTRTTAGGGRFVQLAVSSVINAAGTKAKDALSGVGDYNGDQVRVEPAFSPDTEAARRAVYDEERPLVTSFEYADLPGHAVVDVTTARVTARIYAGASRELWRAVDLTALMG
ncbi:metallophosphoesterase [Chthoniobacter flavus Ellin428]|uniref:Metallophosphoesterase n=1 Tax=Chthoniobacter flavus Ellin428 TaxID=497964 RepID=B4D491_9BACT|nr:metallophosphoesterase [Chthoniobacter flavus]EDY18692.1 metallophosphoesterase [Chthoniobacter flavus Ellin428]TCO89069.1 UDP-2,3-diacylglucosamine pyrophosphatase LpxH [Chthoniobacter flavus]